MKHVTGTVIVEYVNDANEAAAEYFNGELFWTSGAKYWTHDQTIFVTEIDAGTYRVEVVQDD